MDGFLGSLLGPLLKVNLSLKEIEPKSLTKNMSISLGLTAAAWAVDIGIAKNLRVWNTSTNSIRRRNEWHCVNS